MQAFWAVWNHSLLKPTSESRNIEFRNGETYFLTFKNRDETAGKDTENEPEF